MFVVDLSQHLWVDLFARPKTRPAPRRRRKASYTPAERAEAFARLGLSPEGFCP